MTIQEVKNKIESNVNLVGECISAEVDLTKGAYTRLVLEYLVPMNPSETTIATFIAHGISGSYSMDKSYDFTVNMFKGIDFKSDTEDYLNKLTASGSIVSWSELVEDVDNPELLYSKVYINSGSLSVPTPWILVRSGAEGVSHSLTTFDQFPIPEEF